MSNNSAQTRRIDALDIIKTIAIFYVITLHAGVWQTDFLKEGTFDIVHWGQYAFRLIAEGVPLFFMVNGYLLFRKESVTINKHWGKIWHIILIFALWTVILSLNHVLVLKEPIELRSMIKHFISQDYTGILWFLKSLIFVYILYPLLKQTFDGDRKLYRVCFYVLLSFTVVSRFFVEVDIVFRYVGTDFMTGISSFLLGFMPLNEHGIASLLFFMLGGILSDKEEEIRRNRILWISLGFVAWISEIGWHTLLSYLLGKAYGGFWFGNISEVIICIGLYALLMDIRLPKTVSKVFTITGDTTMAVYLLHTILLGRIYNPNNGETVLGRLIFSFLIGVISCVIGYVIGKIPYIRRLVKVKNRLQFC